MDKEKTRNKKKEKDKRNKARDEVGRLCTAEDYQGCLDYIAGKKDINPMRDIRIFEATILCFTETKKYGEALALIADHKNHGHTKDLLSPMTNFCESVCTFELGHYTEAYFMFKRLLSGKDVDDGMRKDCIAYCEAAFKKKKKDIEDAIQKIEDEICTPLASTPTSTTSTSTFPTASTPPPPPPPPTASTPPPPPMASTPPLTASTSAPPMASISIPPRASTPPPTASTIPLPPPPPPPPPSTASTPPPLAVDVSCPKIDAPPATNFSVNMSFEMTKLDERSYSGCMKTGVGTFQKSFIIPTDKEKSYLDHTLYRAPITTKGSSSLLKSDFEIYSPVVSSTVCVVEPVRPVKVFFEKKLEEFQKFSSSSPSINKEGWWKFIHKSFHTTFRGIICGLIAIHSAKTTCSKLGHSMYVTESGEGRIFFISGRNFSIFGAQKDLDDLLSIMEDVVTLNNSQPRNEDQDWFQEFKESYKLPSKLLHFFQSLRDKKVKDHEIQTTWLIDHPNFWPFNHQHNVFRTLNDLFREGLIDEKIFLSQLHDELEILDWRSKAVADSVLSEIYGDDGDIQYNSGCPTQIIHFIHSVINHFNDRIYTSIRFHTGGSKKITPQEIEERIESAFPTIHTVIYDIMCDYANDPVLQTYEKLFLPEVVRRCSSLSEH